MIVNSEYVFLNTKLKEKSDIIENTPLYHAREYVDNYCRKIEIKCKGKNLNERKNKKDYD